MKKKVSTLGFVMECLEIQTVSIARVLHVDSSLVSKWKSGDRKLSVKSIYFEEMISYLMEQSAKTGHQVLIKALRELYPHENVTSEKDTEYLLRQALQNVKYHIRPERQNKIAEGAVEILVSVFEKNSGRRQTIRKLLEYAEGMEIPGKLIFVDSEEYEWLLEEEAFATEFAGRMEKLLKRGFKAQFAIHYSSYRERFVKLFESCSPLIFDRNVEWFYYEYYDENVMNLSFYLVNHAVVMLGMAAGGELSTTIVFTGNALVLKYEALAEHVIKHCKQLFLNFTMDKLNDVIDDIYRMRKRGTLYAFLPAPAFLSAKEELLKEVMEENSITEEAQAEGLEIGRKMRAITHRHFSRLEEKPEKFVHIFQLEEMLRRARTKPFISCSLTLLGDKNVRVSAKQYASCIRSLADGLAKHENLQIVLVSEEDHAPLPGINCWCKQNTWMVQMDEKGYRLSDEISIVNAASITLERCVRRVPPERKEKESVRAFLLNLAEELEMDAGEK